MKFVIYLCDRFVSNMIKREMSLGLIELGYGVGIILLNIFGEVLF